MLFICADVMDADFLRVYIGSKMMVFDVHVFGSRAVFVFSCHFKCSDVIFKHFTVDACLSWVWDYIMVGHFFEKVHDWNRFTKSTTEPNIFRFTAAKGNVWL